MHLFHDPRSADYGSSERPEQPARIVRTVAHLKRAHPDWDWRVPTEASDDVLLLAHTRDHLDRLLEPHDFDGDTPFVSDISGHARRAVGSAMNAAALALASNEPAFSLMRPPGHHATAAQAMGFCYLNSIAVTALYAQKHLGAARVAVWDFDAHHGNGTEAILRGRKNLLFASVHQSPGYPGTGTRSFENCHNWPISPQLSAIEHMSALRESLDLIMSFHPDLILVSAGFDAYADDPITDMQLTHSDFSTLAQWLREATCPTAAVLEGGYSPDLPLLIDAFLSAWKK